MELDGKNKVRIKRKCAALKQHTFFYSPPSTIHTNPLLTREYILMYKENSFYNYSRKRYSTISLSIRWLQKSFKKVVENSQIYLDCIAKPRTFAPAFQERDSLTIDILLKFKALENKNKKTSKKVWKLSEKVLIFASAFAKKAVRQKSR